MPPPPTPSTSTATPASSATPSNTAIVSFDVDFAKAAESMATFDKAATAFIKRMDQKFIPAIGRAQAALDNLAASLANTGLGGAVGGPGVALPGGGGTGSFGRGGRRGGGGGGGWGGGGGYTGVPSNYGRNLWWRTPPGVDPMTWYGTQQVMNQVGGAIGQYRGTSYGVATAGTQAGYGYDESRGMAGRLSGSRIGYGQAAEASQAFIGSRLTAPDIRSHGEALAMTAQATGAPIGTIAQAHQQMQAAGISSSTSAAIIANAGLMDRATAQQGIAGVGQFATQAQAYLGTGGDEKIAQALKIFNRAAEGVSKQSGSMAGGQAGQALLNAFGRAAAGDPTGMAAIGSLFGQSADQFRKAPDWQHLSRMNRGIPKSGQGRSIVVGKMAETYGMDPLALDQLLKRAEDIVKAIPKAVDSIGEASAKIKNAAGNTLSGFQRISQSIGSVIGQAAETPMGQMASYMPNVLAGAADIAMIANAFGMRGRSPWGQHGNFKAGLSGGIPTRSGKTLPVPWGSLTGAGKGGRMLRTAGKAGAWGSGLYAAGNIIGDIAHYENTNGWDWGGNTLMAGGTAAQFAGMNMMATGAGFLPGAALYAGGLAATIGGGVMKDQWGGAAEAAKAAAGGATPAEEAQIQLLAEIRDSIRGQDSGPSARMAQVMFANATSPRAT